MSGAPVRRVYLWGQPGETPISKGCGTSAAARRHQRHKEPLDEECRVAMAEHQAKMRRKRKGEEEPPEGGSSLPGGGFIPLPENPPQQSGERFVVTYRACDDNLRLFYPEGDDAVGARRKASYRKAKALCATCPALVGCRRLCDSIEARHAHKTLTRFNDRCYGVWAGETPTERWKRRNP